jgi:hypothetical protein
MTAKEVYKKLHFSPLFDNYKVMISGVEVRNVNVNPLTKEIYLETKEYDKKSGKKIKK